MRLVRCFSRLVLFAALAAPASLRADSPSAPRGSARVTIRGTGNAISVDRAEPPAAIREAEEPLSALDDAIRMKASGASDEALVGYLRAHRDDLPAVVDRGTVAALRDTGAGRSVIAYLASVAAVEIGPTGAEGRSEEPEGAYAAAEPYMSNELPADLAWGGWGWGVVPNGDFGSRRRSPGHGRGPDHGFGNRHGPGHAGAPKPMPLPASRPPAPSSQQSVRGLFPRR